MCFGHDKVSHDYILNAGHHKAAIAHSILQQTHIRNYYNHTHLDQAYNV